MPTTSQWNAPQRSFPKPMLHGLVAGGHGKWVGGNQHLGVEPKIGVVKSPQIIHLFIGFSIIFTIHFGVPLFLVQHPFGNIPNDSTTNENLSSFGSLEGRWLRQLKTAAVLFQGNVCKDLFGRALDECCKKRTVRVQQFVFFSSITASLKKDIKRSKKSYSMYPTLGNFS